MLDVTVGPEAVAPKVSVLVLTYNHVRFISQAIESALSQKTDFPYEILIGDDASTDGTTEIVLEYQKKYPETIRAFFHETNPGDFGATNAKRLFHNAKGQYLNLLEGDDYWLDPLKLQIQADFLDDNPDFAICFHNAELQYEDGSGIAPHPLNVNQQEVCDLDDLIGEDEIWFMATASIMSRKSIVEKMPDWVFESKSGDIPMLIFMAKKGRIKFIDRVMSVWRRHLGGKSYSDNYKDAWFLENRIKMYSDINRELDYKYDKTIKRNLARYFLMLRDCDQYRNNLFRRYFYALKAICLAPPRNYTELKEAAPRVLPANLLGFCSACRKLICKVAG